MYCLEQNKTKAFKGLCLLITLIVFFTTFTPAFAEQKLTYGHYPVLRGTTNPQEIKADLDIKDAGKDLRQMSLAAYLGAFKADKKKNIYPKKQLTNLDTIKALVAVTGQDKDMEQKTVQAYQEKAIAMGLVTENELKNDKTFFSKKTSMRKLNDYFSRIINVQTRYTQPPSQIATRFDLADMIYKNKEKFLEKINVALYNGEVLNKSSIIEDGKDKIAITVKLDKNIVIKKSEQNKKNNKKDKNAEEKNYKENQVEKIYPDNQDEETVTNYVNILSQKDVPILTPSGITTDVSKIISGSNINIYVKNNQIVFVEQFKRQVSKANGMLEDIIINEKEPLLKDDKKKDKDKAENPVSIVKIKDFDDKTRIYKLHPDVNILQSSGELGDESAVKKPVDMEQLSYGQDVTLEIKDNQITSITGYVPVEEELNGFVPEESQIKTGTVLDKNMTEITLTDNKTYNISPDTLIMKNGKIQDYKAIKDGDHIKMLFDELYSNTPSKIEIAGNQEQADRILKAKVGPYSLTKKSLTLKDVKELVGNTWINTENGSNSYENLKIKGNIYANSKKVKNDKLKNYNDQEIYVVLAKNQGIPTIEKGKIRLGDSLKYNDGVKNIDYAQNTLQIDNNLVSFDESTIVVKDGNIVSPANIKQNINTLIETNLMKAAQIIIQNGDDMNVDDLQNYPYKVYRGTLRDIFDDTVLLGNDIEKGKKVNHFFMWQAGKWFRFSQGADTPKLKYTEQSRIYDFDNKKAMTIDQFRNEQFKLNAVGNRPKYFDRQVYVITKDDIIRAIAFEKAEGYVQVNSQNTMVARAVDPYDAPDEKNEGNDNKNKEEKQNPIKPILVKNIYQYNSIKSMLEAIPPIVTTDKNSQKAVNTPVRKLINIEDAIVIYDGKMLSKASEEMLKDKKLTIIYRQTRDKKLIDNMETIDAIVVIAE